MKKLFVYMLAAMLAIPAIDIMSKPDTDKDKIAKTTKTTKAVAPAISGNTATLSAAELEKRKPKKVKSMKNGKSLKRKFVYRKGARQI